MSAKNILFKNIASLGVVQIANYVFPVITIPIISRVIGPEKYGVINFASSFVLYFVLLITYGFDLTATRRISQDPKNHLLRNAVFCEVLSAQVLLFLLSTLIFSVCLFAVPQLSVEKEVAVFSFLVTIGTVFTQNWLFQAMQDLPKIAVLSFISKLLFTISIVFLVRRESDYVWIPLVTAIIQIMVSLVSFAWSVKRYQLSFSVVPLTRIIGLLKEERMIFLSCVVIGLYTITNAVILGLLRPQVEVGYYTAAQKLVDVVGNVISLPLSQALYPFVGFAFGKGMNDGIAIIKKTLPIVWLFTFVAGVLMFLFGPMLIHIFYGNKFDHSIVIFRMLCFVPMIIVLSNLFGIQIMLNLKMDKPFFKITAIGALLAVILNMAMTHIWGSIGTAANWVVVEVYITLAMFLYLRKQGIHPVDFSYFNVVNIKQQIQSLRTNKAEGK